MYTHPRCYAKIIEQPATESLRFRYECESRTAGSIPGSSSTDDHKTYPTIQVVGYQGDAFVVVSCVTDSYPHEPHPHNIVGKDGCKQGVCILNIPQDTMRVTFSNIGIQCVKKKGIQASLRMRKRINVDPFNTRFQNINDVSNIDLNAVRLCFQVFLNTEPRVALKPVVSNTIYDKKSVSHLNILKLSHCASYADGGKDEIILLCDKVSKDDVQIVFFEEQEGVEVWSALAKFEVSQVYKGIAICFKAPPYRLVDIQDPVDVFIRLRKRSNGTFGERRPFLILPVENDMGAIRRKRKKLGNFSDQFLQNFPKEGCNGHHHASPACNPPTTPNIADRNTWPNQQPEAHVRPSLDNLDVPSQVGQFSTCKSPLWCNWDSYSTNHQNTFDGSAATIQNTTLNGVSPSLHRVSSVGRNYLELNKRSSQQSSVYVPNYSNRASPGYSSPTSPSFPHLKSWSRQKPTAPEHVEPSPAKFVNYSPVSQSSPCNSPLWCNWDSYSTSHPNNFDESVTSMESTSLNGTNASSRRISSMGSNYHEIDRPCQQSNVNEPNSTPEASLHHDSSTGLTYIDLNGIPCRQHHVLEPPFYELPPIETSSSSTSNYTSPSTCEWNFPSVNHTNNSGTSTENVTLSGLLKLQEFIALNSTEQKELFSTDQLADAMSSDLIIN